MECKTCLQFVLVSESKLVSNWSVSRWVSDKYSVGQWVGGWWFEENLCFQNLFRLQCSLSNSVFAIIAIIVI